MSDKYILNAQGEPEPCDDLRAWARWLKTADRQIAKDFVGTIRVSTVFLSLNHAHLPERMSPVLWETMIFGGTQGGYQMRYETKEEALAGHAEAVNLARNGVMSRSGDDRRKAERRKS